MRGMAAMARSAESGEVMRLSESKVASEVRLGIFAKTFARPSPEGVFDALVGYGLRQTQFNMSCGGTAFHAPCDSTCPGGPGESGPPLSAGSLWSPSPAPST